MTWSDFYLICFAVGFTFSVLSFLLGGLRWHLPHTGGPHAPLGHPPVSGHGGVSVGPTTPATGSAGPPIRGSQVSPFNFATLAAFLAWFGGAGYVLTRYSSVWFLFGLSVAVGVGLIGGSIVFLFLSRVLVSPDESMDAADYDMVGVLGRTSVPIRPGGTGEIIYSQAGTRRTCGARSEDGAAIAKGTEVVVTRYEKGIAYVRLWSEMSGEESESVPDDQPGTARVDKQERR